MLSFHIYSDSLLSYASSFEETIQDFVYIEFHCLFNNGVLMILHKCLCGLLLCKTLAVVMVQWKELGMYITNYSSIYLKLTFYEEIKCQKLYFHGILNK